MRRQLEWFKEAQLKLSSALTGYSRQCIVDGFMHPASDLSTDCTTQKRGDMREWNLSQHQPWPGVQQERVCWESHFFPQPLLQRGGCGKSYLFPLGEYHTRISHVIQIGPCVPPGRCDQQTQWGECSLSKQVTLPCLGMLTLQEFS